MNESEFQALLDAAWKRPLTPTEAATLRGWGRIHSERWPEVEAELQVAQQLHELPNTPVPSNFMSQIWQELERTERGDSKPEHLLRKGRSLWRQWLPRFALAAALAGVSVAGWWRHEAIQRSEIAQQLSFVSGDLPDPSMLKEFEAILAMSDSTGALDVELLGALQ